MPDLDDSDIFAHLQDERDVLKQDRDAWQAKAEALAEAVRKAEKLISNCHAICEGEPLDCIAETSDILTEALAAFTAETGKP